MCKSLSHSLSVIESESTIIQFKSFSKAEMDLYIEKVLPPGIDVEDIAVKTNCNPKLRGGSSVINLALSRIETKIMGSLSKAIKESKPHFLVMSIHLLEKSYTNEKMTKEDFRQYERCVVITENLVYHYNGTLYLSHPMFYRDIMQCFITAKEYMQDISHEAKGLINGLYLENQFCICSLGSSFNITIDGVVNHINVKIVETCTGPLRRANILYHLRPKHPVIDMVGMLEGILIFFEVSIMKYKDHVKAEELFDGNLIKNLSTIIIRKSFHHRNNFQCTYMYHHHKRAP